MTLKQDIKDLIEEFRELKNPEKGEKMEKALEKVLIKQDKVVDIIDKLIVLIDEKK